ncbi:MAG TPA: pyridoxal-phosphate dependent enzyme, partial [Methylomirabilota bacterium]|nr:pyridoxal-phosphate dependent enzyme [Methylomirabilota bacterium]
AVVPRGTSPEKIAAITFFGGRTHPVDDPRALVGEAARLAAETDGHFMDQFTYAERATDWRGNNNIAESIFQQMSREEHPIPRWLVMSAGTGGTSATLGRYVRYLGLPTRLCVVDVERSVFFDAWKTGDRSVVIGQGSRIEGIGRPRCEPSFMSDVIDRMERVPDAASLATMRVLAKRLGRRPGGSTGTNVHGLLKIAAEMLAAGEEGSLVTLICDAGERYACTYYDDDWIAAQGFDLAPHMDRVERFLDTGVWVDAD